MSVELLASFEKLFSILEKVKTLPTEIPGRGKRLFKDVVNPSNDALREVHVNYTAIFSHARNTIRKLDFENSGDQKLGVQDILKTAVTQMLCEREPLEGKRDLLRFESQAFASSVEIPVIRRYLISICDYFVFDADYAPLTFSPEDRDGFIIGLMEKGGLAKYDTPTTGFLRGIRDKETLLDGIDALNEAISALNNKYVTTQVAYQRVVDQIKIF
ncbi:hypothetical protein [Rhizobium sp. SG570]|uniref:hypothetical protein n=1 Tax=Rhizobium sp. SG570 TaxID=2587113 RepID=UPI00144766A0|nr:hypothetical protein [Rhizobium sp. SG570]NKJ37370.1 hypothetical protein [Rhizobium sp. SG570]